jgi:putative transcriptional regulator
MATAKKTVRKPKSNPKNRKTTQQSDRTISPALRAAHETAQGLFRAGVMDKTTMKEFDALCLPAVPDYTPSQIRQIRLRCNASQTVFAHCFNVTPSALQKWEIGTKKPGPVARKLLHIVEMKGLEILFV